MSAISEQIKKLPPIKSTVEITYAGIDLWQDKVWILLDKMVNKYYYLGKIEYEIINRWHLGQADLIVEAVNHETIHNIDANKIDQVFKFLFSNNLLQLSHDVLKALESSKKNKFVTVLNLLSKLFFIKIPLANPDKFLHYAKDYVRFLFSHNFLYFIVILFCFNLYLLANQWGSFTSSLPSMSNTVNIILMLLTIIFTKIIHESGHAFASKIYNCRVSEVGVNLIFFYPLLYTDVSNTILLNAQKRLVVSTAGLRFELYLAVIAGFFWLLLPENSIFKNILFFISAVSWVVSLGVNMMPFMRFDGYYIFSDYFKIRNLTPRSFAILKYYYRRFFFGLDTVLPENYDKNKFRFLASFAVLSAIYRILLFFSIILFLYYIEIIGGVLFVIGLSLLILLPIGKELYNLYTIRSKFNLNKNIVITSICSLIILFLIFVPFNNYVYLPAVFFAKTQRIYTPLVSRIDKINIQLDQDVVVNQQLLLLTSLDLETKKIINQLNYDATKQEAISAQISEKEHKQTELKLANLEQQKTLGSNIEAKAKQLDILAPMDGRVTAIYKGLNPGLWLAEKTWLLDIVNFQELHVQAFATAQDREYMSLNRQSKIIFIPDQLDLAACEVTFISIATDPIDKIPSQPFIALELAESKLLNSNLLLFAVDYGGDINFNIDQDYNWVAVDSFFPVEFFAVKNCNYNNRTIKGVVKIKGNDQSLVVKLYNKFQPMLLKSK
ncbi:MAG: hypothetical protein KBD64_00315 [Gammaproteobacteria bacterium]|nr:hypothetical protein [Gammaproteobacteria bacterium]